MKHKTVGALRRHYSCAASLIAGTDVASVLESQPLLFAILLLGPGWTLQNLKVPQDGEGLKAKERKGEKGLIMGDNSEVKGRDVWIKRSDTH